MESRNKVEIFVAELPDGKDPDEIMLRDKQEWLDLIENAVPAPIYLMKRAAAGKNLIDLSVKKEVIAEVMPSLVGIKDEVSRNFYLQALCKMVGVEERVLQKMISEFTLKKVKNAEVSEPDDLSIEDEKWLLSLLIADEEIIAWVERNLAQAGLPALGSHDFQNTETRQIAKALFEGLVQGDDALVDYISRQISPELKDLLASIVDKKDLPQSRERALYEILRVVLLLRLQRGDRKLAQWVILQRQGMDVSREILAWNRMRGLINKTVKYLMDFSRRHNLEGIQNG
jgi:DNA primase